MKTIKEYSQENRLRYIIVLVDETKYWSDSIQQKIDKAYGQYLVDLTSPTNCCELSVSYPAHHVRNEFINPVFEDVEELCELEVINCGGTEYWNENTKVLVQKCYYLDDDTMNGILEEMTKDQWIEHEVEYYNCNHLDSLYRS